MTRRSVFKTWDEVESALEERRIPKAWIGRYYDIPRQVLNNVMKGGARVTNPNSAAIWDAIEAIEQGVWTEGAAVIPGTEPLAGRAKGERS